MKGISRKDLRVLVNGFWMTLGLEIGGIEHNLACFGVMGLVSHNYILTCIFANIDLYIIAGSGKTILAYVPETSRLVPRPNLYQLITLKSITS